MIWTKLPTERQALARAARDAPKDKRTEEQQQFSGQLSLAASDINQRQHTAQGEVLVAELTLDVALPPGYHQLTLTGGSRQYQQQLIITPQRCFQLHDKAVLHKTFGPALQLYAVKSARNWGIGDFTDLAALADTAAQAGAAFVGISPVHALRPGHRHQAVQNEPTDLN